MKYVAAVLVAIAAITTSPVLAVVPRPKFW